MTRLITNLCATSAKWRERNKGHDGGVVLIWQGEAYGWKNYLRDVSDERPGVYAVDEAGQVFIAEGGDYQNGAERWVKVCAVNGKQNDCCE